MSTFRRTVTLGAKDRLIVLGDENARSEAPTFTDYEFEMIGGKTGWRPGATGDFEIEVHVDPEVPPAMGRAYDDVLCGSTFYVDTPYRFLDAPAPMEVPWSTYRVRVGTHPAGGRRYIVWMRSLPNHVLDNFVGIQDLPCGPEAVPHDPSVVQARSDTGILALYDPGAIGAVDTDLYAWLERTLADGRVAIWSMPAGGLFDVEIRVDATATGGLQLPVDVSTGRLAIAGVRSLRTDPDEIDAGENVAVPVGRWVAHLTRPSRERLLVRLRAGTLAPREEIPRLA